MRQPNEAETFSIGEVSERSGVSRSAIRYYESIGLLDAPRRAAGRRRYDERIFDQLALLDLGKRAGFSLSELRSIAGILASGGSPSDAWRRMAEHRLPKIRDRLRVLCEARALLERGRACGCVSLEACEIVAPDRESNAS